MNKTKTLIWLISIVALCALSFILYTKTQQPQQENITPVFSDEFSYSNEKFSDGLTNPDSVTQYPLDELGMGISEKTIYYIDINNDNKQDRITKTFTETGNAHSYYEYKIEMNNNGNFIDITPNNFKTTNGDDCDLQQIQFIFKPTFHVVLIYRELGETWNTPTIAKKQTFKLTNNKLEPGKITTLRSICDVKELF